MSAAPDTDTRRSRRIEPVPEQAAADVFDPAAEARRGLAVWLAVGPVLAGAGFLGFLRLLASAPVPPPPFSPWSVLLDGALVLAFAASHSLLARGFGRRLLNRPFGPAAERPLYVLATGLALGALVLAWRPCGPLLWHWEGWPRLLPGALQVAGLALIAWGGLVVGAPGLFGLPHLRALESGAREPQAEFTALPPYSFLRQPINLGFLLLLAGMPVVTFDRFVLGAICAAWILLAAPYEERDLEVEFDGYCSYRERTPRWLPRRRERDR